MVAISTYLRTSLPCCCTLGIACAARAWAPKVLAKHVGETNSAVCTCSSPRWIEMFVRIGYAHRLHRQSCCKRPRFEANQCKSVRGSTYTHTELLMVLLGFVRTLWIDHYLSVLSALVCFTEVTEFCSLLDSNHRILIEIY